MRRKYGSVAFLCLAVSLALANCSGGGGDGGGGGPTEPTIAQMGGVWSGVSNLKSATGCGCIGAAYQTIIGFTANYTAQINQSGSAITARTTNNETGLWCDSTGTVGSETFALNAVECAAGSLRLTCQNGNMRDLFLVSAGLQGSVFGNNASGTTSETWNCFNSKTGAAAGVLTLQAEFKLNRG